MKTLSHRHQMFMLAIIGIALLLISNESVSQTANVSLGVNLEFSEILQGSKPSNSHNPRFTSPNSEEISFSPIPWSASGALGRVKADPPLQTRGIREASLYRNTAPSVVLIVTENSIGSGTLIGSKGEILTNWHVISEAAGGGAVGVIFKPRLEGVRLVASDIRPAKILKIDEVSDLALLRVNQVPQGISPLAFGDPDSIAVGLDVHAIGHPTGEAWTYTRGVISQIRRDYIWSAGESSPKHRADVIQTQTPINPGNSGGPLLSDSGKIIGVNSFKSQGEGLNFAVSVEEIGRFLTRQGDRRTQTPASSSNRQSSEKCEPKEIHAGRNKKDDASIVLFDLNCDGKGDAELLIPDNEKDPAMFRFDRNKDGKIDAIIFDTDRDAKWDYSFWDNDFDGKIDLVGHHPDGKLEPTRYEKYDETRAKLGK